MPPYHPPLPAPPNPTKTFFDPYNSSSTGHQRAEHTISSRGTPWRESRSYKLSHQLKDPSGRGGIRHISDLVGEGSEHFGKDGRKPNGDWEEGAPGLREKGWQDIRGLMRGSKKRSKDALDDSDVVLELKRQRSTEMDSSKTDADLAPLLNVSSIQTTAVSSASSSQTQKPNASFSDPPTPPPQIFRGLNIYLNGSTAPLVSDHKLKQLFAQHGGNASQNLARRTVTHVIIGDTCGGGLASRKINKEITTVGGKGIRFVTAHWVLDSIEKGIRQPEARYVPANLSNRIGGSGQGSVRGVFTVKAPLP